MEPQQTERLAADEAGIARAAALLRAGALVAFPTETVYGLGADARSGPAVAGIFEAKGRPQFNPLIVHVPDLAAAERIGVFGPEARALADAFWPGPVTLVVPLRPEAGLSALVTAGLGTVGLRVPQGQVAQDLLRAFRGAVAAPSANPSGRVSPTMAEHVREGLDGRIAAIVDGGPCAVGLESTIVGVAPAPVLLRPGGVAEGRIARVLGAPLAHDPGDGPGVTAPGQLASHYAPAKPLRLNAAAPAPDEAWLGFGPSLSLSPSPGDGHGGLNLSETGDLREAAANLFAHLRTLDRRPARAIAVAPVPDVGLGVAINDRLRRAAAP
ncbi:MAG: L-threonylcarbamoyladenylate synthase, partial [Pseudomonadota bacterium]